ncbi:MAG TPA: Crp/Fnr family transcriptional regulator [Bacillota bacterium]|jgi:CRP-like cAMP-binding protein
MPKDDRSIIRSRESSGVRDVFARLGRRRRVPAGEVLFEKGEVLNSVYYVERGTVLLNVLSPEGAVKTVLVCSADSIIGESCLQTGYVNVCSAEAQEACVLLEIPRETLRQRFPTDPTLAQAIYDSLISKLQMTTTQLEWVSLVDPARRIARFLLESGSSLAVSHEALAAMAGCCRVTVTRHLGRLKRGGAVSLGRKRITVINREILERIAKGKEAPTRLSSPASPRRRLPGALRRDATGR